TRSQWLPIVLGIVVAGGFGVGIAFFSQRQTGEVAQADEKGGKSKPKTADDDDLPTRGMSAPELDGGVAWLNTGKPLTLKELKGKVVLLDFWTLCCINCIHVFPDLARLEEKYANELVVIGVHSAKFEN